MLTKCWKIMRLLWIGFDLTTELIHIHSIFHKIPQIASKALEAFSPHTCVLFRSGFMKCGQYFKGVICGAFSYSSLWETSNLCCLSKEYFWHKLPQNCKANARAWTLFGTLMWFSLLFFPRCGVNYPIMLIGVLWMHSLFAQHDREKASFSEAATYIIPHTLHCSNNKLLNRPFDQQLI